MGGGSPLETQVKVAVWLAATMRSLGCWRMEGAAGGAVSVGGEPFSKTPIIELVCFMTTVEPFLKDTPEIRTPPY